MEVNCNLTYAIIAYITAFVIYFVIDKRYGEIKERHKWNFMLLCAPLTLPIFILAFIAITGCRLRGIK